eukprot:6684627-Karenia_brevis.AAC.1
MVDDDDDDDNDDDEDDDDDDDHNDDVGDGGLKASQGEDFIPWTKNITPVSQIRFPGYLRPGTGGGFVTP